MQEVYGTSALHHPTTATPHDPSLTKTQYKTINDRHFCCHVLSFIRPASQSVCSTSQVVNLVYSSTTNKFQYEHAFYDDASLAYFGGGHWPYGLPAIVLLAVFVIVSTVFFPVPTQTVSA